MSLRLDLKEFILSHLQAVKATGQRTIGLEQELFLLDSRGRPASHDLSQRFLKKLATLPNWQSRTETDPTLGNFVSKASHDDSRGYYTVIKYDHHPHLLEVAFAPQDDLHALEDRLTETLTSLNEAAHDCCAKVALQPFAPVNSEDKSVVSELAIFKRLRSYREKIFRLRGEATPPLSVLNYAATIAATQVHIGGLQWWKSPKIVSDLYCFEPVTAGLVAALTWGKETSLLHKRWAGYLSVFKNYPLVAFPDLKEWSLESWIDALCRSPLAYTPSERDEGLTLDAVGKNPFISWEPLIKAVRDLQIIRPRIFGTLEFRSDPAQTSPEKIVALAALRLGLSEHALFSPSVDQHSFPVLRSEWLRQINDPNQKGASGLLDAATAGLKLRSLGEERFLEPLRLLDSGMAA